MEIDTQQRINEIESMMVSAFSSVKSPQVRTYDDQDSLKLQLTWVTESHGDSTLDSRCVATLQIGHAQLARYEAMPASERATVRRRIDESLHAHAKQALASPERCSMDIALAESVFSD
jgi:Protein of unknown function (DUF3022)